MLHRHQFLGISLAAASALWLVDAVLVVALGSHTDREKRALLHAEEQRRVVVQSKLDDALTRMLDDFLPICSHCKAIRWGDNWVPLESYVTGQTKSQFSHGLCPKCLPLYDDSA